MSNGNERLDFFRGGDSLETVKSVYKISTEYINIYSPKIRQQHKNTAAQAYKQSENNDRVHIIIFVHQT